jgi:hypothetical protein
MYRLEEQNKFYAAAGLPTLLTLYPQLLQHRSNVSLSPAQWALVLIVVPVSMEVTMGTEDKKDTVVTVVMQAVGVQPLALSVPLHA